ncbi:MAG TPA: PxKF domain-containing protein [Roseiflexaceae bacterium]|nr:PxKF domain-containing protein [Roseiflexaceae bacterium]
MSHTFRKRFPWLFALAIVALLIIPFAALADDISNNLDATVDAVAEVMPLTVGGANGTTQLYVVPRNGDGKNGCNLTGSTTLVVSVTSSNTGVATVSPASITFGSCGDTPTLTVSPHNAGSATISLSQTSNNTGGTFNLATATFTVNVAPPPNTAPTVVVAGVTGGASYEIGSVPAATCNVTDAEDGNSSFPATLSAITGPYASDGIGSQTASCSYTDGGGITVAASETYGIVDPSAPSINYTLNPASPDGSNGWYKSDVTLTWNVSEPESPNSLQKTDCVDQNITADQLETSYSCSATSAGGSAGPVSVSIKRDATAPTISGSISPAANSAGWNNTDVSVSFTCSDNLSGVASCGPDQTLSGEGAGQSVSGAAVDNAGNSASTTVSGINIDKTPPTITFVSRTPAANAAGWNNSDVTLTWSCTDGGSGVIAASISETVSSEGANQSATGTCTDLAGNSASDTQTGIKIDKTAPTVSASASPAANANGWNNTNVTVSFTGSDGLSGIDSCDAAVVLSGEGANQSATGTCTDKAGNVSAPAIVSGINIDKTAPTVSLVGGPANGASYYFGFVPAAPTCSASDALSGLDEACAISGYGTTVGSHTVTASATDKAGNTATATRSYTVLAWTLKGFYQPVDMNGVLNTVKNGSTVPLKFEVFAGSTELTDVSVVKSATYRAISCSSAPVDDIELTATGGTVLRYDATSGQFIFNWQTPKTPGACYRVTVTTQDGSSIVADFKLK